MPTQQRDQVGAERDLTSIGVLPEAHHRAGVPSASMVACQPAGSGSPAARESRYQSRRSGRTVAVGVCRDHDQVLVVLDDAEVGLVDGGDQGEVHLSSQSW
ncbi:hypothetical protein [Pseudofrankia sp. BMG5.37]|uniref:hypothetical protein n=1 Tax=Pseudofrankia sp. BMG5.37 TaxID=3050035 RepID=UPI00289609DE|nr:hypothetical protein [Pseudofrankia sp. BMG5.37]MDT3440841.1 hypothetical protein [Pseudofrankia sp. BMG5.37]